MIFYFSLFQISDMTDSILDSFKTILSELEWMDKDTREVAEQKVRGLLTSKRILERPISRNKYLVSYKDSIYIYFFKKRNWVFFFFCKMNYKLSLWQALFIKRKIGYEDSILEDDLLNRRYENVSRPVDCQLSCDVWHLFILILLLKKNQEKWTRVHQNLSTSCYEYKKKWTWKSAFVWNM